MRLRGRLALVVVAGVLGQLHPLAEVVAGVGAGEGRQIDATLAIADRAESDMSDPRADQSGRVRSRLADATAPSWPGYRPAAHVWAKTPAILRIADFDRSDPRLAGLMLRCGEDGVEIIIVVVEPFPPRAQPKITLRVAEQEFYFAGSVIPTGAGIRLPVDGMKLATAPWLKSQEVGIKIADGDTAIDGVVPLSDLAATIASLDVACARN